MKRMIDIHRLNSIKELLLAIAEGNLSYQIDRSQEEDQLESIVVLLNWLTVELQASLLYFSTFNPKGSQSKTITILFTLDHHYKVTNLNDDALTLLNLDRNRVIGKSFSHFLNNQSTIRWNEIIQEIEAKSYYSTNETLYFNCGPYLRKKYPCTIQSVDANNLKQPIIVITSFEFVPQKKLIEDEVKSRKIQAVIDGHIPSNQQNTQTRTDTLPKRKPKMMLSDRDVKIAQDIRDYILKELEYPMLSISELARKFNTNESKVKKAFAQLHNISIFRFYTEERLKRASHLLETCRLPIYKIAKKSGFKNISHFATAFKKYYTVSPSVYRKLYNKDFK
ncbi:helix-turn-helix domain-containing protein [Xanthomarina gelatinilytica]|uniref:AraC family transcriptional regulator n=1 Tax=Xanthomarina gelatinilytica TaxID=1137281 RepID=UPI003AA7DC5D